MMSNPKDNGILYKQAMSMLQKLEVRMDELDRVVTSLENRIDMLTD